LEERFDPFRDSADYTIATQLNLRDPTVFIKSDVAHQTTAAIHARGLSGPRDPQDEPFDVPTWQEANALSAPQGFDERQRVSALL
jgi:hypothetical protein